MRISQARPGSVRRTLALLLGACGLLAGCGTSGIQVQREAHLPPDSAGARFVMLAARGQDNDPVHARDAEMVASELAAHHFVRVTEPAEARFAVMVWDRRGEGATDPTPRSDPTAGATGRRRGGAGGSSGRDTAGGGGGRGPRSQDNPPQEYVSDDHLQPARHVEIQIYDITRPQGPGQHVFTADARITEAEAHGRGAPELIAAALRDFPGSGSQSYSIR